MAVEAFANAIQANANDRDFLRTPKPPYSRLVCPRNPYGPAEIRRGSTYAHSGRFVFGYVGLVGRLKPAPANTSALFYAT